MLNTARRRDGAVAGRTLPSASASPASRVVGTAFTLMAGSAATWWSPLVSWKWIQISGPGHGQLQFRQCRRPTFTAPWPAPT
jgi:hypothetical protein